MGIKGSILKEILIRKDIFKKSSSDMISAYNREVETEKEYNGRQLLELLQNADDENSDEVLINLNTTDNKLIISNRGENCKPFSYEGIRSLMISNLSPKTTKKFIGNKGLGFRSIINWSNKITINSNELDVEFSKDVVNSVYDELFDFKKQKMIQKDWNLPESIKPIPFLSIPHIIDNPKSNWTTSITVEYKAQFLSDIQKQISELKNEILLFLNSIKKLTVTVDHETIQEIDKSALFDKWEIYTRSDVLPKRLWDKENEEEFFDLKIATQDNHRSEIKELFSYFPTKIVVYFSFIVHGTFELNSSRNELNDSLKNRYILKELVKLVVSTAKGFTKEEVSYKALEMLSYSSQNNILEGLDFYEEIDAAIETLKIFPCLDGIYRAKSEVVYINELSIFVKRTNNEPLFKNLLIPVDNTIDIDLYGLKSSVDTEKLNMLSQNINCIKDRVDLIYMFYNTLRHQQKLMFLIDENEELISLEDDVYTPSSLSFSIPDFVKIKFIHETLFEKLVNKFEIVSNEKPRDLQRKLKEITNIQSYEPAPVLQKIITSTNKKLDEDGVNKTEVIKKMVKSLYKNYTQLNKTKIPGDTKIQLLNKSGALSDTKELYLSISYPSGELTEFLFDKIFTEDDYLADVSEYEFQDGDLDDIERFFLWLGVNKHTRFRNKDKAEDTSYTDFVFQNVQKPIKYRNNLLSIKEILCFEGIVEKLSYEKLILWFCLDEQIYFQLDIANNADEFKYEKDGEHHGNYQHRIHIKPSYILYQIKTVGIFNDYFVGSDKLSPIINDFDFDFDFEAFEKYGVNRSDIESVLLKIGAVNKFDKLSIDAVNRIVKDLPIKSPEGKNTQSIYKLCIKHFERHKEPLTDADILLFATKQEERKYFKLKDVFYNGNIKLPNKITNSKAVFNYPRRQSTKNVIGFFGVNNLSSLKVEVDRKEPIILMTDNFNSFFEQIRSYILVYRIHDIEGDKTAMGELTKLKNINIELCEHVHYKIDGEPFELEDNDYIKDGKDYLIKINKHVALNDLRAEFDFQECFADIIGLVFDIQETKVFRDMIKEDFSYIEKTIRNDIGSDELIRSRELLGISDESYSFWKTVYSLIGRDYVFESNDNLLKSIVDGLNIQTDLSNMDLSRLNTYESCCCLKELFDELNIEVAQFNKSESSYYKIDFRIFHNRNIKQAFENKLGMFKDLLYSWSIENGKEKLFINNIGIYNHNDDFIMNKSINLKFESNVNYNEIVELFVEESFDLFGCISTGVDYNSVYDKNKQQINIDDLCGSTEYLSLMYFENSLEEIREYIDSKNAPSENVEKSADNEKQNSPKSIVDTSLSPPDPTKSSKNKERKPYKHNQENDRRNKENGNSSEQDAYISLVNEYGKDNVVWESNDDDSLGYDLKYKNKDAEWKYVEVKTYSAKRFHLTRTEMEFAQKNIGLYEIFLVGEAIHRVTNVDFSDKNRFSLIGKEFIVNYNIEMS